MIMKCSGSISMVFITFLLTCSSTAQEFIQYPAPSIELKMEEYGGKNGASVAYNPIAKLYYCVIAGNETYPLETFDRNGMNVYQSEAYNDLRGLWWNPKEKALEGNCYAETGIVSLGLAENGYAWTGNQVIFSGSDHQPDAQSVGTYDPKKKEILYYDDGIIVGYSRKDGSPTKTYIQLDLPVDEYDINWTTLVFTGEKKMELGVLNPNEKRVYLFNRKDGSYTGTLIFPADAPTYETFNFAYANGFFFLFDQDERKWIGYKVF
jgi:hypothetical protein